MTQDKQKEPKFAQKHNINHSDQYCVLEQMILSLAYKQMQLYMQLLKAPAKDLYLKERLYLFAYIIVCIADFALLRSLLYLFIDYTTKHSFCQDKNKEPRTALYFYVLKN